MPPFPQSQCCKKRFVHVSTLTLGGGVRDVSHNYVKDCICAGNGFFQVFATPVLQETSRRSISFAIVCVRLAHVRIVSVEFILGILKSLLGNLMHFEEV